MQEKTRLTHNRGSFLGCDFMGFNNVVQSGYSDPVYWFLTLEKVFVEEILIIV